MFVCWPRAALMVACAVLAALSIVACAMGLAAQGGLSRAEAAQAAGDADAAEALLADETLRSDPAAMQACYGAFARAGEWDRLVRACEGKGASTPEQTLLVAQALFEEDRSAEAAELLIAEVNRAPYRTSLLEQADGLFVRYGLPEDAAGSYREAIDRVNILATEDHAAWLDNQERFESKVAAAS